jgi:peptidoglycan/xylan/chitin deacetylase (PgdA/CDA1 family)
MALSTEKFLTPQVGTAKHPTDFSIPILMYHEVTKPERVEQIAQKTQRSFIVTIEQFAMQMEWLGANGFSAISLAELLQIQSGARPLRPGEKPVVITFDDGFSGNYFHAFPILRRLNLSATIFIIVGRIGEPFYMTWQQLEALAGNGVDVQSHTMTHALLGQATMGQLIYELRESKREIEKRLGMPVHFISMPHGSCHKDFAVVANDYGYRGGCTSEVAYAGARSSPFALPRLSVNSQYDLATFMSIAQSRPEFVNRNTAVRKAKRLIKNVVGEKNYNRAYHLIYGVQENIC